MKIKFDETDIVVLATAYGQRIVRTEHPDDSEVVTYVLTDRDANGEWVIDWRGSLDSCIAALTDHDGFTVAINTPPLVKSPDPEVNNLLDR